MESVQDVLHRSGRKAFLGGLAGMGAQAANVLPLMWLRTIMTYQYRHGGSLSETTRLLYADGGVPRFYRGLAPALFLAPVCRFGDTAANELALDSLAGTQAPLAVKTMFASVTAAAFRVLIMPLDTWKVMKQVQGKEGFEQLREKVRKHPLALWHGAYGMLGAQMLGHFPFFFTNNQLRQTLPQFEFRHGKHVRNAVIGFASAVIADTTCNPVRVLKVNRQTSLTPLGYQEAARTIWEKEGILGLWGRGLGTRILANGIQGAVFTVLWKAISDWIARDA